MAEKTNWQKLGPVESLRLKPLQQIEINRVKIALSYREGEFHAISGICNHAAGPLGDGTFEGDYITCPWHYYKFHYRTGEGEPGYEQDRVPTYKVKIENDELWIDLGSATLRGRIHHDPHPLTRPLERQPGPLRVVGISTTVMDNAHPRPSTSELLLEETLQHGRDRGFDTHLLRLRELKFRHCEGFYSKSSHACTWPCSITQMDPDDQLDRVYEDVVHWADVMIVSTPIRWGSASSLYYKMVERFNCIQNQITINNRQLIQNKVAGFIITGGQDNVQAVAGHLMGFFSELGFHQPPFPFIAHSLGWSAENMEHNIRYVQRSHALVEASKELLDRCTELSKTLITSVAPATLVHRAGRKAYNANKHRDN